MVYLSIFSIFGILAIFLYIYIYHEDDVTDSIFYTVVGVISAITIANIIVFVMGRNNWISQLL